ncbi:DUF423 domain-containing protein [Ornithobacterium rhinotracheale]|uniref:DUF423 domain-containing protein n=1 Tax=Ornithobacterium rhinotracheale TaxID=28251 RepID=UPI001FF618D6|nr:DUF423 domain-containing protein [Ornithobacterium rhinotracheale]MCK0204201.1 DUF423 domain-containing protein [Ornithobacterium rhinotracheale]
MKQITLIVGAAYGMASIILGAFGAHAFKKILSVEKLMSFEVGVRYMMYHALLLLILGFYLNFKTSIENYAAILIMIGCFFFSVSIYILAFSEKISVPTSVLGPITPIGGILMILGWGILLFHFIKTKF